MTDASLHNGQPLGTGTMCQSVGLNPGTPAIADRRDGVSVGNAPAASKQWFVLRVSYGRIAKAQAAVEAKGLEHYVPLRYKQLTRQGKNRLITVPLLPSFVFVHASAEQVDALLHDRKVNASEGVRLLSYYFDHTRQLEDHPDRNPPLTIRDAAMDKFIRLTSIKNPHVIPVTSSHIRFKLGDHVVVTEGEFSGVHGRVARIAGQQRVVVQLFDGCLVATAYVPKGAMKILSQKAQDITISNHE